MGLTGVYNASVPEDVAISLIKHAFSKGITFFDTSDLYGPHVNEVLLGKVLLLLQLQLLSLFIFWFSTICM
jgi:aryl-alcohol dehydrogenase-like predicted oxidoreductase